MPTQQEQESHADKIARLEREIAAYYRAAFVSEADAYRCEKLSAQLEALRAESESQQALSLGKNLETLRREARLTIAQLASEATNGDRKAVREHIRGEREMRPSTQQIYERVLSKKLGRAVSLSS